PGREVRQMKKLEERQRMVKSGGEEKRHGRFYNHDSLFTLRVINSWIASRGDLPSCSTACIFSVIGISTPFTLAKPSAAFVVNTPAAPSPCIPAMISGGALPCPSPTPPPRWRESPPVHVRTRSPNPARPPIVSR